MTATLFQYGTPTSITGSTSWTGAVTDVDEPPPFNDSDIMQSPSNSSIGSTSFSVEFQLATLQNPNYTVDGFAILIRASKNNNTTTQIILFTLKQAGVAITSGSFTLTVSASTQTWTLSAGEIAALTYPANNLTLVLTAPPPTGALGSNNVVLSGCALQIPSVGFDHLILNSTGFKIVGPHYGLWLARNSTGYVENVGSETTGALIDLDTEHA